MAQLVPFEPRESDSTFPVDFELSMHQLRGALTNLMAAAGEDSGHPQGVSRSLKINKNLAWKVCKIINSTEPYGAAQHVPGRAGFKILMAAFQKRGLTKQGLVAAESAMKEFERMIRLHVGDRGNLELYVGATESDGIYSNQLEAQRRAAYQGNSVIWGVQARLGMTLKVVAPNAEAPDRADLASIGGLFGFRRLRSTASWPVLRHRTLSENVVVGKAPTMGIDEGDDETGAPLVRDFCSTPLPPTRALIEGDTTVYELSEGPVGNTAALDVTFGGIDLSHVPISHEDLESVGEHYCRVDTPVEVLQFDLLIHRDLPFQMPPKLITHSALSGNPTFPLSNQERFHLPGRTTVQQMGLATAIASPHIPRYGHLVSKVCTRMGHDVSAFQCYRVSLTYPPLSTILVMYHPLGRR